MNWMSTAAQIEAAQLEELNRKVEARQRARNLQEAEARADRAECKAQRAEAAAERKLETMVRATAGMACMVLGVCVMRAQLWIGLALMAASAGLLLGTREGDAE